MATIYQNYFFCYSLLFFICWAETVLPGWQLCFGASSHQYCEYFDSDWVKIANQTHSYRLSDGEYTYCEAELVCEQTWQGIRCPHGQGNGLVLQFTGPAVYTIAKKKNTADKFRMLCKKNDSIPRAMSTTTTTLSSSTLQTIAQRITHSVSSPTTHQITTPSNLQTNTTLWKRHWQSLINQTTQSTTFTSTASPSTAISSTPNLTTSRTSAGSVWKTIGQEEFFINYEPMSYNKAEKFCQDAMNASLVMFLNPVRYFTILAQIALKNNSFWVGAHGMKDECLSYIAGNMSLTTSPCHLEKFSVCSRILGGDISRFLEDPKFKRMIQEMTVFKNKTGKKIRKLTCAQDRRPSSRAVGGVGIFIICSVIAILLISDCSSIKALF